VFVDRRAELKLLGSLARHPGASLLVLYGRRRVGKTELLREFCKSRRSILFVADQRPASDQLRDLSARIWELSREQPPGLPAFPGWGEALSYAGRLARHRSLTLVIDEFPYLALAEPGLTSVLQRVWDEELSRTRLFLVLCGSSVSYMESEVLGQRSPLFGRRSAPLHLEPLGLPEAAGLWRGYSPDDMVRTFAVVGGVPAYAARIDPARSLERNVQELILDKNAYLYEEVPFLLMQELREPRVYMSLMQAIAAGKTKSNEIADAAGLPATQAGPYLRTLADLRLVQRVVPVDEPQPHRSRKGRYRLQDPYFRFWFRFVFPNRSRLDQGLAHHVWASGIAPRLDEFVSIVFEDLAEQHLWALARSKRLPFVPERMGRWYAPAEEVDCVALSRKTGEALVVECKWSNRPVGLQEIEKLRRRAEAIGRQMRLKRVYLGLFSRSGFEPVVKRLGAKEGLLLVTPREMVRPIR